MAAAQQSPVWTTSRAYLGEPGDIMCLWEVQMTSEDAASSLSLKYLQTGGSELLNLIL